MHTADRNTAGRRWSLGALIYDVQAGDPDVDISEVFEGSDHLVVGLLQAWRRASDFAHRARDGAHA